MSSKLSKLFSSVVAARSAFAARCAMNQNPPAMSKLMKLDGLERPGSTPEPKLDLMYMDERDKKMFASEVVFSLGVKTDQLGNSPPDPDEDDEPPDSDEDDV